MKWFKDIGLVSLVVFGSLQVASINLSSQGAFLERRAELAKATTTKVAADNATEAKEADGCTNPRIRYEIHELSDDQLSKFHAAMDKVRSKGIYADLCRIHLQNVEFAHGTQYFLPWHREIINRLEEALRAEDDSVTLPYWDWSVESQFPEDSIVFTNKYFGGNGGGGCIGGRYSNSGMGCVLRNFDQGRSIGAFAAPEVIRSVLRAGSFSEFWNRIEASPHGNVHNNIGGDMATMSSCKDPFFYLHHAYIDKLWAIWQRSNSINMNAFSGSLGNRLNSWGKSVGDVMDINGGDYCYTYTKYGLVNAASRINKRSEESEESEESAEIQAASVSEDSSSADTGLVSSESDESSSKPELQSSSISESNEASEYLVDPYDRENEYKLRAPNPLPESYCTMMKLDIAKVRKYEEEDRQIIIDLNKKDDYISPVALSRKDSTIKEMVHGITNQLHNILGLDIF